MTATILAVVLGMTMPSTYDTEQRAVHEWVAAKFDGVAANPAPEPGLYVLANNDAVLLDSRFGAALKIGSRTFKKALFCHAVSKVLVVLPSPGDRFGALVGLDHNPDTARGRGSVVFSVNLAGKALFTSPVMRYADEAVPVDVALDGSTQFSLDIGDAGDGIGWDQSVWGDARVQLRDGTRLWLSDLKLHPGAPKAPPTTEPPFGFNFGGQAFQDVAKSWLVERTQKRIDRVRTQHTTTYTDPASRLEARCVAVEYDDFPTVEWTLYLRNGGKSDTPLISDIQAIATTFGRSGPKEFVLHHENGSPARADDYEPRTAVLDPRTATRIATAGGRPTNAAMPYFNLEWEGEGRIVAIGWPGQWAASFVRDDGAGLRVQGGQELTRFVLHPGEEVRGPLIALQFTNGDVVGSQNLWRRWMVAHNVPRPGGKLPSPVHVACSSHQFGEMINANEANQKEFVDGYLSHGFKLDYWWMDAGWYVNNGGWPNTGTWEVDRKRFPNGLRAISDHARAKGVKTIVWFEPERVNHGTWLYDHHPEWLLGPDSDDPGSNKLLDLGNPQARAWLTDHVDKLLTDEGIDLYRQDYNIDPLPFWRGADAPDRQGITEIRYVEGYLAYWDELRRRHPNMLIDSCASGGRRNDLETLRRAVPLLRSDYIFEPIGQQCHTYGLSSWVPFQGSGHIQIDPYNLRSVYLGSINTCWDVRRGDLDYPLARKLMAEWRSVADCFLGDYYPLTPYTRATDQWIAWQFDLPSAARGVVQAFRREQSVYESARLRLQGLDPKARYEMENVDSGKRAVVAGRELMEKGLLVVIAGRPGAAVIRYRRVSGGRP